MIQELVALLIVAAAGLYLIERMFGVASRFRKGKAPPVQLGNRLRRGLKNARRP